MDKPLSAITVLQYLASTGCTIEPIYVRTPSGEVLELTRMAMINIDDGNGGTESVSPIFMAQYTDIVADIESSFGEPYSELPPS